MKRHKVGKVWLVGAGPGDPELLTLGGLTLLAQADVVMHDALIHPGILRQIRAEVRIIEVGKRAGGKVTPQAVTNRLMIRHARAGRTVVRLKGGDPFLFGRGGEEVEALRAAGIPYGMVPGVTSALAAPAAAGIPLTHRAHAASVGIVTGRTSSDLDRPEVNWEKLATAVDTLVLMMGTWRIREIAARLIASGRSAATPVAAIQWATWPNQQVVRATLATAGDRIAALTPPTVIVIGSVAGLATNAGTSPSKPLLGHRIGVTTARSGGTGLWRELEAAGGVVLGTPAIAINSLPKNSRTAALLGRLARFDWLVMTSATAVDEFRKLLASVGKDSRAVSSARIAAIGEGTAFSLEWRSGLKPDLIPRHASAEGLLAELKRVRGMRILIPRAEAARDVLPRELSRRGAEVTVLPLYRTVPDKQGLAELRRHVLARALDVVTFTSGSTVDHTMTVLGAAGRRVFKKYVKAASIGPVTSQALRSWGIRPAIQAKTASFEALARAIVSYYRKHPHGH